MNITISKTTAVSLVLGLTLIAGSVAAADEGRALRTVASRGMRELKAAAPRGRAVVNNSKPRANAAQSLQNLNTLGNILNYSDRSRGGHGSRDYGNGYGYGYGDSRDSRHHDRDRGYADAYRDVGIANAVVDLVGIIANSGAPQVVYEQPCARYERAKVLVQEGHYEETRVWVSHGYDPCTRVDRGHYEIQRRWVPDVYEYRDVLVR